MAKWLVTGAAGFIGSNIVEELINRNEEVIGIDDLSTGDIENIKPFLNKFKFIEGSITDLDLLKKIMIDVNYVIHEAAIPSVPRSINEPIKSHEANCTGTLSLLLAVKDSKVKKLVYAASSSAYGDIEGEFKKEDMPSNPLSPYAAMKLYGEHLCKSFSEVYGIKTVCLRYFNVFGPRQDPNSEYSAVIPIFIKSIMNGKSPTIYGDGKTSRDFTYVLNNVNATINAALSEVSSGEVINIATGDSYSLIELVETINKILGKNIKPIFAEERKGDVKHSKADISKAKKLLNYEIKVNFEEGIKKTIEALK
jgi:nucleoside-diphosphate-sugar epimerase